MKSASEKQWSKDIVEQTDGDHIGCEEQGGCRVSTHPTPDDQWDYNDRWTDLDNSENEDEGCDQTGGGNSKSVDSQRSEKCL